MRNAFRRPFMVDRYTKAVLTVIAVCLIVLAAREGGDARAQGNFVCGGSPADPCFVQLGDGPAPLVQIAQTPLPVTVRLSEGTALPVDVRNAVDIDGKVEVFGAVETYGTVQVYGTVAVDDEDPVDVRVSD